MEQNSNMPGAGQAPFNSAGQPAPQAAPYQPAQIVSNADALFGFVDNYEDIQNQQAGVVIEPGVYRWFVAGVILYEAKSGNKTIRVQFDTKTMKAGGGEKLLFSYDFHLLDKKNNYQTYSLAQVEKMRADITRCFGHHLNEYFAIQSKEDINSLANTAYYLNNLIAGREAICDVNWPDSVSSDGRVYAGIDWINHLKDEEYRRRVFKVKPYPTDNSGAAPAGTGSPAGVPAGTIPMMAPPNTPAGTPATPQQPTAPQNGYQQPINQGPVTPQMAHLPQQMYQQQPVQQATPTGAYAQPSQPFPNQQPQGPVQNAAPNTHATAQPGAPLAVSPVVTATPHTQPIQAAPVVAPAQMAEPAHGSPNPEVAEQYWDSVTKKYRFVRQGPSGPEWYDLPF